MKLYHNYFKKIKNHSLPGNLQAKLFHGKITSVDD